MLVLLRFFGLPASGPFFRLRTELGARARFSPPTAGQHTANPVTAPLLLVSTGRTDLPRFPHQINGFLRGHPTNTPNAASCRRSISLHALRSTTPTRHVHRHRPTPSPSLHSYTPWRTRRAALSVRTTPGAQDHRCPGLRHGPPDSASERSGSLRIRKATTGEGVWPWQGVARAVTRTQFGQKKYPLPRLRVHSERRRHDTAVAAARATRRKNGAADGTGTPTPPTGGCVGGAHFFGRSPFGPTLGHRLFRHAPNRTNLHQPGDANTLPTV